MTEQSNILFVKERRSNSLDRLTLQIPNRTKFFVPDKDKALIECVNPESFSAKNSKRLSYRVRLYWHYKYCEENDGQVYYYTLTYNDRACPMYMGHRCFDYSDLVHFLNGGFKKYLERNYGTDLKYFVGAELGEGAGRRGIENNPHYHILFFLTKSEKPYSSPYIKISPEEFRSLVRNYWQGFDEDKDGWHDYRFARYGIAKEGSYNLGKVCDFRACMYCAKYVTKDVAFKKMERSVLGKLHQKYSYLKDLNNIDNKRSFYEEWLLPNTGLYIPDLDDFWKIVPFRNVGIVEDGFHYELENVENDFFHIYNEWCIERFDRAVKTEFNEFRNRYSNKVRISNGVGDYALKFITNKMNPTISVPDEKKGTITVKPSQYYYRKLFTKLIKFVSKEGNKYIRVLNCDGVEYKVKKLSEDIKSLEIKTESSLLALDESLYRSILQSSLNDRVSMPYEYIKDLIYDESKRRKIVSEYAIYKLVYKGRCFKVERDRFGYVNYPDLSDYFSDYRRFISPSYYVCRSDDSSAHYVLSRTNENFLSYGTHPRFFEYLRYFDMLDLLGEFFAVQDEKRKETDYNERERIRKFHARNEFINKLKP